MYNINRYWLFNFIYYHTFDNHHCQYTEAEVGAIKTKIKVLSGAQLKYIAFLSMLIDHTNKALIYPNLNGGRLNTVSDIFDIIGRIAFPIFAFLLAEGF